MSTRRRPKRSPNQVRWPLGRVGPLGPSEPSSINRPINRRLRLNIQRKSPPNDGGGNNVDVSDSARGIRSVKLNDDNEEKKSTSTTIESWDKDDEVNTCTGPLKSLIDSF